MSAHSVGGFPRHPKSITPSWLTAHLRDSGALPSGTVASVGVDPVPKWNRADTARLAIAYDGAAPKEAPRRLFAKITAIDDPFADVFAGEFAFYRGTETVGLPLARCYGAFQDSGSGATCLLLEDLSATHSETSWPLPPSLPACEAAVTALARLHAHWWHDVDDDDAARLRTLETRLAAHFETWLPGFFDALGDRLPADRRHLVSEVFGRLSELKGLRLSTGHAATRAHGDAHLWNFLYPKDPQRDGCILIDWEDWRDDIGISDLAYMIALHWYPDRRARHEDDLLRSYLEALRSDGAIDYSWDELRVDYRLGHLQNIVVPIYQQGAGLSHAGWWSHLERWFLAFEDLDCHALL